MKKDGTCHECEEDMPGKALAMAYVPWQTWRKLYEVCEGFKAGTIFKELDLEFMGRRCN
ncbi:MAG: spore coat associated protein CotJA [Lachnospiraceae bacterium]|nr:spore coat associated protein CotJA [Lachnospiraceae bacterium]